jgi:replicative DNA helicase
MTRSTDISPLSQLLAQVDAVADGAPNADTIATGFPSLDRVLGGGVRRGDLVVLGGDVGSGKSALALAMALRAAESGRNVAYFSGEMTRERVMERVLAIEGRVRIDDLRQGTLDEVARAGAGAAAVRLREWLPRIERLPTGGAAALEERIDRGWGLDLLVVDPVQSLPLGTRENAEELADAVRRLKRLALDLEAPVLATAQLTPEAGRDDRRPQLDDFGALGAVKHHADVVLALFREEMYGSAHGVEGATELAAIKNRNGPTGYVDLYFYAQWMRFEDMLDPDR